MSNFKPGDRVRRIDPSKDHLHLGVRAGQVYTVDYVAGCSVYLAEVAGPLHFDAAYFVLHNEKPVDTTHSDLSLNDVLFSMLADMVMQPPGPKAKGTDPAKDAAIQGGLQKHSVGDFYPLAVVGYGNGNATKYVVENLQDQTVACGHGIVRQWSKAAYALRFMQRVANKATNLPDDLTWLNGRPLFVTPTSTQLVMPGGAKTLRTVVKLQKQDGIIEIKGAYYKAIEQDIG